MNRGSNRKFRRAVRNGRSERLPCRRLPLPHHGGRAHGGHAARAASLPYSPLKERTATESIARSAPGWRSSSARRRCQRARPATALLSQASTRSSTLHARLGGPGPHPTAGERLDGQAAMLRHQVLVQPRERAALPLAARAGLLDPVTQPREVQAGIDGEVHAARSAHVAAHRGGHLDHLARHGQIGQRGAAPGQIRRACPGPDTDPTACANAWRSASGSTVSRRPRRSAMPAANRSTVARDVDRSREIAQEPFGAARRRLPHRAENGALACGADLPGQQLQLAEQRHQAEGVAGDDVGARDRRRGAAGALAQLADELAETAVDQAVGDQRRDDLAAQTVLLDLRPEALAQRPREILDQIVAADRDRPAARTPAARRTASSWRRRAAPPPRAGTAPGPSAGAAPASRRRAALPARG